MPGNTSGASQTTLEAAADLTLAQYGAVFRNTSGLAALLESAASMSQVPLGVLYNNPNTGQNALVRKFDGNGKINMNAGEAIAIGDRIAISTSGMAITLAAVGQWIVGVAATATGAAGQRFDLDTMSPVRANSL